MKKEPLLDLPPCPPGKCTQCGAVDPEHWVKHVGCSECLQEYPPDALDIMQRWEKAS